MVTRSRVALACAFGGSAIYTMRADGTDVVNVKPLAPGTSFITAPVWSPDGRSIAFSHEDGTHDIFIVTLTGGNEARITKDARLAIVSDWQRGVTEASLALPTQLSNQTFVAPRRGES